MSAKFQYGYHEIEDIKQEIAVLCLEGVKKYNGKFPLVNFLWVYCHNNLCNHKRKYYERKDEPCLKCPLYDAHKTKSQNHCLKYVEREDCKLYRDWQYRNMSKKSLMNPASSDGQGKSQSNDGNDHTSYPDNLMVFTEQPIDAQEILDLIDVELPSSYREDFIKFKYGIRISEEKEKALLIEIRKIAVKHGLIENE
jgi:hypothetical protein